VSIDEVLAKLQGINAQNGYFIARCPAHDDHDPSLSVKEGTDGRVLLKCHAGCTTDEIIAALGCEMRDLFDGRGGKGRVAPLRQRRNSATPPQKPHRNAESTVATTDATPDNGATPPDEVGYPHLRLVGGTGAQDCTLEAYAPSTWAWAWGS
jgi:hypothetical protein